MGYDLRHLLIGAEGTLGVITAASLRLHPAPAETATAWIAVASPAAALDAPRRPRASLGGSVSAFELDQRPGPRLPRREAAAGAGAAGDGEPAGSCWPRPPTAPGPRSARGWRRRSPAALEAGRAEDVLDRPERRPARRVLGGARIDPRGEPADRRDLQPRHLAAAVAAGRVHRPRRPGGRGASARSSGSTASAISATATCTTTCFRRGARPRRLRRHPRSGQAGGPRPRARARRLGRRRARGGPAEDRRPRPLRRPRDGWRRCGRSRRRSIPLGILNPGAVLV